MGILHREKKALTGNHSFLFFTLQLFIVFNDFILVHFSQWIQVTVHGPIFDGFAIKVKLSKRTNG